MARKEIYLIYVYDQLRSETTSSVAPRCNGERGMYELKPYLGWNYLISTQMNRKAISLLTVVIRKLNHFCLQLIS